MRIVSFHLDGPLLKVALLAGDKQRVEIELLRSFPCIEEEGHVKPLNILASLLTGRGVLTASALDSWELFVRELHLNLTGRWRIHSTLPFQLEPILPFPVTDALIAPFLYPAGKGATDLTLLVTTQNSLTDHLKRLRLHDIDPEWVGAAPHALLRFAQHFFPKTPSLFYFHLGMHKSAYGILDSHRITCSQTMQLGADELLGALAKDLPDHSSVQLHALAKEIALATIDPEQMPHLFQAASQFQKELERVIAFLKKRCGTTSEFLLTGNLYAPFKCLDFLEPTLRGNDFSLPIATQPKFDRPTLQAYAIPIGLGIDILHRDTHTLQFRRASNLHPALVKKRMKRALIYAATCLSLAAVMAISGHFLIQHRERHVAKGVEHHSKHRPLPQQVEEWEKALETQRLSFAYLPTVPKVSDVLAWLSTHPILVGNSEGTIDIKRIRYQLIKYPKLGVSSEPYQAQVELEFSASSPRIAREFHEALLKGDRIVNAKQQITWTTRENSFFTSFYLLPGAKHG